MGAKEGGGSSSRCCMQCIHRGKHSTMLHHSRSTATQRGSILVWLCLCVLCLSVPIRALEPAATDSQKTTDIQSLLNAWDSGGDNSNNNGQQEEQSEKSSEYVAQDPEPLGVLWGISDTTATLGKAFQYKLPSDAFKGNIANYQVTGLPSWLHFNPKSHTLLGVPSPQDLGKVFYITVTAHGEADNVTLSQVKDIFAINVVEDNVYAEINAIPLKEVDSGGLQPIKCQQGSSVTMVTIVIDTDLSGLAPIERLALMEGLAEYLKMPVGVMHLLPKRSSPMFDSGVLVAGPGDVKEPQHSGVLVEWVVGCGNVHAAHMPILTKLESTSHDGSMSQAIGHKVIGWQVTNNKPQAPKRLKRQAWIQPTATQEIGGGLPTGKPVSTVTVTDQNEPTTRDVPTMASPTFTGTHPTHTHSHKHHRTKTTGRHHHHKTKHPKHSPTKTRTGAPKTMLPTASMTHIQPTRVVEVTSTMEPSVTHILPPIMPSSPGVSRTMDVIEPSMAITPTPSMSGPTQVLPTRPYTSPIVTSSTPIEPSATKSTTPATDWVATPPTPTSEDKFNFPPMVKEFLRPLRLMVGEILNYTIPETMFHDYEDGNTRSLKLVMMTIDGLTISPMSWIKLDSMSQTLYGLPREDHIAKQEYLIAAIDNGGKIARAVLEVNVERRPRGFKITHELSMTLDFDYTFFVTNVDLQIQVATKLATLYGDQNTSMMMVTSIEKGSVRYAWTNVTLPKEPCPSRQISELGSYLITKDNEINPKLIEIMRPFEVVRAGVEPKGLCATFKTSTIPPIHPGEITTVKPTKNGEGEVVGEGKGKGPEDVEKRETSEEEVLITTVIPAVVIAAMLLLAGLIACILYRKKRKGKLSDEDQHTFINKGIPIIFSDELDERPDQPSKPLILADEKPPLPPPDYPRSASGSQLSTPRSDHKEPLIDQVTTDEEGEMSPYHPPPPVMGSLGQRGARSRNQQPAYRAPPPYVPP